MNTRDSYLITRIHDGSFYAISPIIRQLVIDECMAELSKYAHTSHSFRVLSRLKEKGKI
jgi:hypothetical protein